MLSFLEHYQDIWGPFRLFSYLTFRAAMAAVTAMVIGFLLAPWVINKLRALKLSQSLRTKKEVGKLADLHSSKKDIPTMGGLLIYFSIVPTVLLWAKMNIFIWVSLIVYTGLSVIGFIDDYLKTSKRNSKGISSKWKLGGQGLITLVVLAILLGNVDTHQAMSELWIPFYKQPLFSELPLVVIVVFFFFVMAGTSNAINLTDGVDGLAIGCTIPAFLVFGIMAYVSGNHAIAEYLNFHYLYGIGELTIFCSAAIGASLVFLWYNCHPAQVFMGDTGSLSLGGVIGAIAFMIQEPITLVIVGGVFVIEALSVILQIASFKTRGKRIFRMAPIHHHFELKNWHENKVVIRFWVMSFLCMIAGLATLKLR